MAFKIIFLEEFGKAFVPNRAIPHLREYLLKAGIIEVPYKLFGGLFYLTAIITGLLYIIFIMPFLQQYSQLILLIASTIAFFTVQLFLATFFILVIYFYVDLKIFKRTKKMEEMLPDFLQVVSSNLKGGLSFENALWGAIKPRFSILANEMAEVSKKVMTGYPVGKALDEFAQKYDSAMLKRAIDLMISELESGGKVTYLIDNIVVNFKETKVLKEEAAASAMAYTIFLGAIVIVIAPLLFSLSFHLLIVILSFVSNLASTTQNVQGLPISFSATAVNPEGFKLFSVVALAIISFFTSLIVSIVEKGTIRSGLRYIPIFMIGSLGLYFIFMKILGIVFSGLSL